MPTDTRPTLYKFLTAADRSGADGSPWTLGEWRAVEGDLVPCERGLHAAPIWSLPEFLGASLYRVEIGTEYLWHDRGTPSEKLVARKMRLVERIEAWDGRTARLFAAACAERVLTVYEQAYPDDRRPRQAIETARRFANGQATKEELAAARAAAWDAMAAGDAYAAWAAVRAAAAAAWGAAAAAARAAAWAATWDASAAPGTSAGAAWAAARAAAAAAWGAAAAAARAAARAATWDASAAPGTSAGAAWAAARAAEQQWQARRLAEMLSLPWEITDGN